MFPLLLTDGSVYLPTFLHGHGIYWYIWYMVCLAYMAYGSYGQVKNDYFYFNHRVKQNPNKSKHTQN